MSRVMPAGMQQQQDRARANGQGDGSFGGGRGGGAGQQHPPAQGGGVSMAVPVPGSGAPSWRTDNPYADGTYLGVPQGYQGHPTYVLDGKVIQGEMFYKTGNQYDYLSHMDDKQRTKLKVDLLMGGFYKSKEAEAMARATLGASTWAPGDFEALSGAMGLANLNGRKLEDVLAAHVAALNQPTPPSQADSLKMQAMAIKAEDGLRQFAAMNGLQYSDDWYKAQVKGVVTGQQDYDSLLHDLRVRDVAGAFPGWAKQIEAGQSVASLASPYVASMQRILGANADLFDPTIRRAMQSQGGDGQPTTMPMWQFEQQLRNDPRWAKSDDAKNGLGGEAQSILNTFGLV